MLSSPFHFRQQDHKLASYFPVDCCVCRKLHISCMQYFTNFHTLYMKASRLCCWPAKRAGQRFAEGGTAKLRACVRVCVRAPAPRAAIDDPAAAANAYARFEDWMDATMAGTKTRKPATQRTAKGGAASHAYDVLRAEIIQTLAPGSPLDEEVFARLGLSRTPGREAIARLAGERLVELSPNRSARVAPVGMTEIREHIEGLDVMQRLVTRWAAARRTDEEMVLIDLERRAFEAAVLARDGVALTEANWRFHNAIGAACRNSIFEGCYRQILTEGLRIDRLAMFREAFAPAT